MLSPSFAMATLRNTLAPLPLIFSKTVGSAPAHPWLNYNVVNEVEVKSSILMWHMMATLIDINAKDFSRFSASTWVL